MFGGIHAKRGFNYQDTVVLEILIAHFDEHGPSSTVRPEGLDDLELSWTASDDTPRKRFVQVKKPREDTATNPTGLRWRLAEATEELLPGTLRRLTGNTWEQYWVLGDDLAEDARCLFVAGDEAATREPQLYWSTVHRLAKQNITTRVRASTILATPNNELASNFRESPRISPTLSAILMQEFGTMLRTNYLSARSGRSVRPFLV